MIAKDYTERLSTVALSVGLIIPRRRRTGTKHGNVYRSVREKQGNVVYQQRVLQTVTSLRVVSLVFRGPHENRKYLSPARSHTFAMEKISSPREWRK